MIKKQIAKFRDKIVAIALREVADIIGGMILDKAKQPVTTAFIALGFRLKARADQLDSSGRWEKPS